MSLNNGKMTTGEIYLSGWVLSALLTMPDAPNRMFWEDTVVHEFCELGDNVTLNCTLAALPYKDVSFQWVHTGPNGSRILEADHQSIDATEVVSSTVSLYNLNVYSFGNVSCAGTNEVGTGEEMVFHLHQAGELACYSFCLFVFSFRYY